MVAVAMTTLFFIDFLHLQAERKLENALKNEGG